MLLTQLRHSFRSLGREPGFTASAIATLALGIGASSAMFSVFHAVLLAPVPYADPDRVVALQTRWTETGRLSPRVSGADWIDLAASREIFESVARYHGGEVGVQLHDRSQWADAYWTSPDFFRVFQAQPERGRGFTDADEERSTVVSAAFARKAFGDTDRAIGQVIHIDTHAYQVVGVMPAGFSIPAKADVWVAAPPSPENHNRTAYNYHAVARLRPGVSIAAAGARLASLGAQLGRAYPENRAKSFVAVPLRDSMVRNVRSTVVLLMLAVSLVLLISCTNVAHLMLARAATQTREFAIRAALGGGRGRIAVQVLTESLAIGLAGGAAGIALAYAAVGAVIRFAPENLPRVSEIRVDATVLAFAVGVAVLASVLFGLAPAWQLWRSDVQAGLRSGGSRGVVGGGPANLRNALVACEIALSFTLAVGAGLLGRSMVELNSAALGFRTEGILVAYAHAPANTMPALKTATRFFDHALNEVERMPGVKSAAASMGLPAGHYGSNGKYAVEGQDFTRADQVDRMPDAGFRLASRGYFATLGIPVLAGREFRETDQYDAPFVAVISDSLAKLSFPQQNPLGKKIRCGLDSDQWMTVVGVVGDVRSSGPAEAPGPELYMPFEQHPVMANELELVLRTAGPPEAMADALARKIRALNPEIAIQTTTLHQMVFDSVATPRFRAFLVTTFAAVALLLAMAGLYGLMAYLVTQRTSELGLRMALGCAPSRVVRLVLQRAGMLAAAGLAGGLALCVAGSRLLEGALYGVHATDAAGYAAAVAAIALVTLAAAAIPAWRAARIDPMTALRRE